MVLHTDISNLSRKSNNAVRSIDVIKTIIQVISNNSSITFITSCLTNILREQVAFQIAYKHFLTAPLGYGRYLKFKTRRLA